MTQSSHLIIDFGSASDQALLGGSFHGPEKDQTLRWNWIGDSPAWVVLPIGALKPRQKYRATLEAAPFSPHNSSLQFLTVSLKGKVIHTETAPRGEGSLSEDHLESPLPSGLLTIQTSQLPPPTLDILLNNAPIEHLEFRDDQALQPQEFEFETPDDGSSRPLILTFTPGRALSSAQAFSGADKRSLSVRLFRVLISTC